MMKEGSNNYIILIGVLAIALSVFSMFLSLEKLGITGASSTGYGYTNVTVSAATDITVVNAQINFTDSNPGETKDSHVATHIAASACSTDATCGINITNDGSVEVNISMANTETLFDSATLDNAAHYLYNITLGANITAATGDNLCSTGYSNSSATSDGVERVGLALTGGWRSMPVQGSSEIAICALNNTNSYDSVMIDVNITVPDDEPAGIKSGTITFTATQWLP